MDLIWPADSMLFWGGVTAFAFAIATGLVRRWVMGRAGVRRGVIFAGAFIGVAVVVGLMPSVIMAAAGETAGDWMTPRVAAWWTGAAVLAVAGLGVLARALVGDPSRGRRRCGKCWYDMGGTPGLVCPECGRAARDERRLLRTRRRKRWVAVGVLLLAGAGAGAVVPVVEESGWTTWVPNTALVVMLPHMQDDGELLREFNHRFGKYTDRTEPRLEMWRSGWRSRLMVSRCRAAIRKRESWDLMEAAAEALGNIASADSVALEVLFDLFEDRQESYDRRSTAHFSLTRVPWARERLVAVQIAGMDDTDQRTRMLSISALSMSSNEADGVLELPPRLLEIASADADSRVQRLALRVLGSFRSSDEAVELLTRMVESPIDALRGPALSSLVRQMKDPDLLHPILLRLAGDPFNNTRLRAVMAIAQYGPYTDAGLEELIRIADLPAADLERYAGYIYEDLAQAPIPLERRLAVLERALEHDGLRTAALDAIDSLGIAAQPLVPTLLRLRVALGQQEGGGGDVARTLDYILSELGAGED